MNLPLSDGVREMLAVFGRAGIEAWLVGGCVRDGLLGRTPNDIDIATAATPDQVQALFAKTAPTGVQYGTVTVFCGGAQAEVTTFRSESGTRDTRHPARVVFGASLRDDLARRDFTINAMAWYPERGLYDPFGGEADLKAGLVRAVGEPCLRFAEDALRVLRAYRFAAQLGFTVEPRTRAAAVEAMPLAAALSGERVREEWEKLLCSPCPVLAFLPELAGVWCAVGLPVKPMRPPAGLADVPARAAQRWAAFVFLSRVDAGRLFARLHFANRLADEVRALVGVLSGAPLADAPTLKAVLERVPPDVLDDGLLLRGLLLGERTEAARVLLAGILERGEPYRVEHLTLRGGELAELGFSGTACGQAQRALLHYVRFHPEQNTQDRLRAYLLRHPPGQKP